MNAELIKNLKKPSVRNELIKKMKNDLIKYNCLIWDGEYYLSGLNFNYLVYGTDINDSVNGIVTTFDDMAGVMRYLRGVYEFFLDGLK